MYTIFEVRGQRRILEKQLEKRFGPLSPAVRQRFENWPDQRLTDLALALLDAESLRDLGLDDTPPSKKPKKKS